MKSMPQLACLVSNINDMTSLHSTHSSKWHDVAIDPKIPAFFLSKAALDRSPFTNGPNNPLRMTEPHTISNPTEWTLQILDATPSAIPCTSYLFHRQKDERNERTKDAAIDFRRGPFPTKNPITKPFPISFNRMTMPRLPRCPLQLHKKRIFSPPFPHFFYHVSPPLTLTKTFTRIIPRKI